RTTAPCTTAGCRPPQAWPRSGRGSGRVRSAGRRLATGRSSPHRAGRGPQSRAARNEPDASAPWQYTDGPRSRRTAALMRTGVPGGRVKRASGEPPTGNDPVVGIGFSPVTGTLGLFSLIDLFQLLASARRSGRLSVDHPKGMARVYFDKGQV